MRIRAGKDFFTELMATYVICWTFIPPMQVGTVYRLLAVICMFGWFILTVSKRMDFFNFYYVLFSVISIAGNIVLHYLLSDSLLRALIDNLQWIIILSVGFIVQYYIKVNPKYLDRLFLFLLIIIPIFCITTIRACVINPYASRIANSEWLAERFKGNENVGLYGFVYMCVFCLPCMIYLLKTVKPITGGKKMLLVIDVILIASMILVAGYSLAILCAGIACIIVLFMDNKHPIRTFAVIVLMICFLLNFKVLQTSLLEFLVNITKNNIVLHGKFKEIQLYFNRGIKTGDLASRLKNYADTIRNFTKYPVLGAYFWGDHGGGGHSFLMDSIGRLGWFIGGLAIILMIHTPFKMNGRRTKNILDYGIIAAWLLFLLADPICQELAVAMFVVFPIAQMMVGDKKIMRQGGN